MKNTTESREVTDIKKEERNLYKWEETKINCSKNISELEECFPVLSSFSSKKVVHGLIGYSTYKSPTGIPYAVYGLKEVNKNPAECLTQIANSNIIIAQVQMNSARLISQSILKSSQLLSNSIDSLTNEIERKNKIDEYYMLLSEIDKYEDTLLEMGCYDEAYEKLLLVEMPIVCVDEAEMRTIISYSDEVIDKVMLVAKEYLAHPLVYLAEILYNLESGPYGLKSFSYYKRKVEEKYDYYKLQEEKEKGNFFIRTRDEYLKVSRIIDSINREILLSNLRNLHSELRNVVREYKIQRYKK